MTRTPHRIGMYSSRRATPADCTECPAEAVGLFSGAFRAQRAYLIDGFRIVQLEPQQILYRFGDAAEYVFILRFGLMKLLRYSSGGDERIVRLARRGETIGLESLSGPGYRHTALAVSETALCRVPTQVILEQERSNPRFVERIMAEMQEELDNADLFLSELSSGSANVRVAKLLLHLAEKEGSAACPLPTREEIGALVGITMETASRIISDFRHRGLIGAAGPDVHRIALDLPGLRHISTASGGRG